MIGRSPSLKTRGNKHSQCRWGRSLGGGAEPLHTGGHRVFPAHGVVLNESEFQGLDCFQVKHAEE